MGGLCIEACFLIVVVVVVVLDHGCCWLKAFPRRKDTGRRKQTRASLVPKKSRTKNDDEGRERSGEGGGNRDGGTMYRSLLPNRRRGRPSSIDL